MQDVLARSYHIIWLLVLESKFGKRCLSIALQQFRSAGANEFLDPWCFELFPMSLDLVVDLRPVSSHDG